MRVWWTPQAWQDRSDIWTYIDAGDPGAAVLVDRLFSEAVAALANFPMMGRDGPEEGLRELIPHPGYRLIYEIFDETVWVLAVVQTLRPWPPLD